MQYIAGYEIVYFGKEGLNTHAHTYTQYMHTCSDDDDDDDDDDERGKLLHLSRPGGGEIRNILWGDIMFLSMFC